MSQSAILRLSLRDLWQHLKPVKLMPDVIRLLIAFFLLLVESGTSVATPWLFSKMVGQLSGSERVLAAFMALIAQYGLISLISGIAGPLRDIIIAPLRVWLKRRVALLGLEKIHKQSARFHVNRQTGALTRIIDRGVDAISTILDLLLSNVLPNVFSLVLTFIVILKVYNIAYIFTKKRMKARRERNRLNGEAHHHLVDSLLNADMVRVFGNQDYELQRHDTVRRELQKAELKLQYLVSFSQVTRNVLIAITTIALLGWAGWDIYDQTLEVAQFVLIGTYLRSVYAAVGSLNYVGAGWRNARVDLENYLELMALEPEIKEAPSAKRLPTSFKKAGGVSIICQNVSFGYSDEKKILKNISFEIPAGKIVAVVGQTGSGKSTLSRLLSRAYDPIEGTIFIDNIDCREIALENLHQITGIVPQDTPLFNTTIGENIAYGRVGSDFVHVKEAAQKAHIDQFIDSLPEGYDTIVGERGVKLSGGEKQRVAIARVILKDPRFLILDEASSALDTKTELAIQKELRALSQSRTTFIIAHRLSTIQEADKIIVLDHGEIKEQGTHDELLKKNGYYSALWAAQSGQDTNHF